MEFDLARARGYIGVYAKTAFEIPIPAQDWENKDDELAGVFADFMKRAMAKAA